MKRNARTAEARPPSGGFRGRLHEVIFEADTRAGRAFDVVLIGLSRVYLGVHYPSDVAAGYVAAFVWVMIVASADRLMEARFRQ